MIDLDAFVAARADGGSVPGVREVEEYQAGPARDASPSAGPNPLIRYRATRRASVPQFT
ncbi:hypothetical protein ACIGXM_22125 [Kitasatospora sp. NPDC052896]|uniref:hypothetical protein n=1 Tax=Kitasatospora sp. NPDC052896 TaxID=3364061 RepID=UPI0037C99932